MKIGVFDSGYGGLTILSEIRRLLPEYDYIYLGDNARAPYGTRSFDVIYRYTLEAVRYLQSQDCHLIILACNTASAKALRTIQQHDIDPAQDRVLGVIRPTVEKPLSCPAGTLSPSTSLGARDNHHIGILATQGTVDSESYVIELEKIDPTIKVVQQSCPMWVPLIENGEKDSPAMDYFVKKYLDALFAQDPDIDTILLACTHYPLIADKIENYLSQRENTPLALSEQSERFGERGRGKGVIICQGAIVAHSLCDYLRRHTDIEARISRGGTCRYLTTESADKFNGSASLFLSEPISAEHISLA